jgi:hypothetical protein
MWRALWSLYAAGAAIDDDMLIEQVFNNWTTLEGKLDLALPLIPKNRYALLRYEDLIRDPLAELERVYAALNLTDFSTALPNIQRYLGESNAPIRVRISRSSQLDAMIRVRWRTIFQKYDYPLPTCSA